MIAQEDKEIKKVIKVYTINDKGILNLHLGSTALLFELNQQIKETEQIKER